jgi:hypothetical protein
MTCDGSSTRLKKSLESVYTLIKFIPESYQTVLFRGLRMPTRTDVGITNVPGWAWVYIFYLFNVAVGICDCIVSNGRMTIMNSNL